MKNKLNLNVLVAMPTEPEHETILKGACESADITFTHGGEISEGAVKNADVIIGNVPLELLRKSDRLRFLQLNMAGSDAYAGKLREGVLLANASGAYGLAISEHMLGVTLMLMKKLYLYRDNQNVSLWHDEGRVTSLDGANVLVVGMGDIGGMYAEKCHLLGAKCTGIRRNPRLKPYYVDDVFTLDSIDTLIPEADVIALTLPNSEESRYLMNRERLFMMKKGAILLNVGRGNAIVTDALVEVLNEGHILAGVDVTDPEPLPREHPLWKCPNIIVTPHISGYYHLKQTHDRIIEIAAENLKRFSNGEPLLNSVNAATGYRELENRK